jgi:hypothetical protein
MPLLPILVQPQQWQYARRVSVSEDEGSAELIVPDGEGGASMGDK